MRILITGGKGMVGSAFNKVNTDHELIQVGRNDYDLLDIDEVFSMFKEVNPDCVIHLAAKVGGVKGNYDNVSDYFHENIRINTNVLNLAKDFKIKKVLSLLSSCVYPDKAIYPLTEDQVHNGEPHNTNFGYAYAKRMLDVQSRAINRQYGLSFITAIPNNIYGENDNFNLEEGHVIPSLIRKSYEAKLLKKDMIAWGDGSPLREFTYSNDIARALLFLVDNYNENTPINIGNTKEMTIRHIVETINNIVGFTGKVIWDKSKLSGQFRKPSSNKKFLKLCPNFVYNNFEEGLENTIRWFIENYPNVRGV